MARTKKSKKSKPRKRLGRDAHGKPVSLLSSVASSGFDPSEKSDQAKRQGGVSRGTMGEEPKVSRKR